MLEPVFIETAWIQSRPDYTENKLTPGTFSCKTSEFSVLLEKSIIHSMLIYHRRFSKIFFLRSKSVLNCVYNMYGADFQLFQNKLYERRFPENFPYFPNDYLL